MGNLFSSLACECHNEGVDDLQSVDCSVNPASEDIEMVAQHSHHQSSVSPTSPETAESFVATSQQPIVFDYDLIVPVQSSAAIPQPADTGDLQHAVPTTRSRRRHVKFDKITEVQTFDKRESVITISAERHLMFHEATTRSQPIRRKLKSPRGVSKKSKPNKLKPKSKKRIHKRKNAK